MDASICGVPGVSHTKSDERILRYMCETEGDEIGHVMKLLDRTVEEQCLAGTYAFYRHAWMAYHVLKDEFGEKGYRMYLGLWFVDDDLAMKVVAKYAGIKDMKEIKNIVKDVPSMAEFFHLVMNTLGLATVVSESSEDRAVVDVIFCPNPMLGSGPFDRYIDRVRYYKETDSSYEIGYGKFCEMFASMCGLGDKIESKLTHIMCLGEPTCRTVFERKK